MSPLSVSFKFKHSSRMSSHIIMLLLFGLLASLVPSTNSASISDLFSEQQGQDDSAISDCDIRQCFTDEQVRFESMSCSKIQQISSCLNRLRCQGNLQYHTALSLVSDRKKRCVSDARTTVRSGDRSPNHYNSNQHRPSTAYRRHEQLTGLALKYCLSAALNYTISSPVSSMQQFVASQHAANAPTKEEFYHRDSLSSHSRSRIERVRRSTDLLQASQAALQFMKSHQARSTESQAREDESMQSDQAPVSDWLYVSNRQPSPKITCMIFGDPHLRTFDTRYETCNSLGTRPLIEHPLFYVQITNSRLKEQFNATGVTKITVLVRGFGPCQINSNLIYESDSIAQIQPSATFTDGSVNNFASMVYIKASSQGQMVTIHLEHIGARVYISQFEDTHFLNVVVKFRSDMTHNPADILKAISPISMCRSGCHPKEVVNLTRVLADAGVETESDKDEDDDDSNGEGVVNIDDEPLEEETQLAEQTARVNQESNDYEDFREYEDVLSARKPPRRRSKRDRQDTTTGKPRQRKNRNKNRKNKKNRKQHNKSNNGDDASQPMLRSSSFSQPQYSDPSDLMRSGETNQEFIEPEEKPMPEPVKTPHDICEAMRGYFRQTCLYDVGVKGISNINPHLFASSFDEKPLEGFSYTFDKNFYSTSSGSSSIPVTSVTFLLVVVAFLYFRL